MTRVRQLTAVRTFATVFGESRPEATSARLWQVSLAMWSYAIALGAYAFDPAAVRAGGDRRGGQACAGALASPFAGVLGDRHSRRLLLLVGTGAAPWPGGLRRRGGGRCPGGCRAGARRSFSRSRRPSTFQRRGHSSHCSRARRRSCPAANVTSACSTTSGSSVARVMAGIAAQRRGPRGCVRRHGAAVAAAWCWCPLWRITPDDRPVYADAQTPRASSRRPGSASRSSGGKPEGDATRGYRADAAGVVRGSGRRAWGCSSRSSSRARTRVRSAG